MASKKGYVTVSVGSLVTFGSLLRTFMVLESVRLVLLWGAFAIIGMLILSAGATMVVAGTADETSVNPEGAPTNADSRYGRR